MMRVYSVMKCAPIYSSTLKFLLGLFLEYFK